MSRIHVFTALVVLSAAVGRAEGPPSRVTLTLHPAATPTPALKYRLLPSFFERRPGNAAPMYAKAMLLLGKEGKDDERRKALVDGPLSDCTSQAAEPLIGDSLFELLELAAVREQCDWELPFHEQNALMIVLPELQEMRRLSGVVLLRARTLVAAGEYAQAIDCLRIVYAMARHAAQAPLLINGLVGQSIQSQADKVLLELVEQPAAPNLYWSLTVMPRPLIDGRSGFEGEMHILDFGWSWWSKMPDRMPREEEVEEFLNDYLTMTGMSTSGSESVLPSQKSAAAAAAALRAAGRRPEILAYVVKAGISEERLKGLTDLQRAILYTRLKYDELRDDSFRWMSLSYAVARSGLAAAADRLKAAKQSDEEILPLATMILPAVMQAKQQFARGERRLDVVRLIEALRIHAAAHGGRLPKTLDELNATPIANDAVTGKPFDYRTDDAGATLTLPEEFSGRQEPLVYEIRIAAKK